MLDGWNPTIFPFLRLVNIIIATKVVEIWNELLELNGWNELLKIIYTWCLAHRILVNSQEVLLRGRVEPSPEVWPGEGVGVSWAFPEKPDISGKSSIFPRAPWSWWCPPPEKCCWLFLQEMERNMSARDRETLSLGMGQNYPTLMFFCPFGGMNHRFASYWCEQQSTRWKEPIPKRKSWICPEMEYLALNINVSTGNVIPSKPTYVYIYNYIYIYIHIYIYTYIYIYIYI